MTKRKLQPTTEIERDVRPVILPVLLAAFLLTLLSVL